MAHQHSKAPKPDIDSTNAVVPVVVRTTPEGVKLTELAPVPETHPGGLYKNADGKWVNAHGHLLEEGETEVKPATMQEILAELGPSNPVAQRMLAAQARLTRKSMREASTSTTKVKANVLDQVATDASGESPTSEQS
jgi:hypothetical protein